MAEEPQPPSSARLGAEAGEYDDGLSAFAGVRPRLFGIAYRMLGSAAEAEDVVQDVWLRWQSTNRKVVENPPAFLATDRAAAVVKGDVATLEKQTSDDYTLINV